MSYLGDPRIIQESWYIWKCFFLAIGIGKYLGTEGRQFLEVSFRITYFLIWGSLKWVWQNLKMGHKINILLDRTLPSIDWDTEGVHGNHAIHRGRREWYSPSPLLPSNLWIRFSETSFKNSIWRSNFVGIFWSFHYLSMRRRYKY